MAGKYITVCVRMFAEYKIGRVTGVRGEPVEIFDGVFSSEEACEHAVFLMRINDLMRKYGWHRQVGKSATMLPADDLLIGFGKGVFEHHTMRHNGCRFWVSSNQVMGSTVDAKSQTHCLKVKERVKHYASIAL